jgi:biotin-dependent carboxylase-like uncharacterized protein
MSQSVLELLSPGLGASIQDQGRPGWRRFGVPTSGAMDDHAALWANRLLGNPPESPVLELLLQGARVRVLADVGVAITGAEAIAADFAWRAFRASAGQLLEFTASRRGVWTYLAVEGGIASARVLASASAFPRGMIGHALAPGDVLDCVGTGKPAWPSGIAGRIAPWVERRAYDAPPPLRVWRGPEWDSFGPESHRVLFASPWKVTPSCDRVGYRLSGPMLQAEPVQIVSEPVRVGSIQVPQNGQPIVTLRDGPTVGGYPKIGMLDPADVAWLTQCRPGQSVRFTPAESARA